jgi:hypothetical protein
MPKTAVDPFFATNNEPVSAGRKAVVISGEVDTYTGDLAHVTSSIIVTCDGTPGTIGVIFVDDPDSKITTIPVPANTTIQIPMQVRGIAQISSGITIIALWS